MGFEIRFEIKSDCEDICDIIKAKQVCLNRFHCSQIIFAKLKGDFRLLKGVDRVLGLRDPT